MPSEAMLHGTLKPPAKKRSSKQDVQKKASALGTGPPQDKRFHSLSAAGLSCCPSVPDKPFPGAAVFSVMKNIVDERLDGMEYSPACSAIATELSDSIKEAGKRLSCERYKLISFVAIGQSRASSLTCSSRGMWSPAADTFTEYLFKNQHLFALCVLFAVYQE